MTIPATTGTALTSMSARAAGPTRAIQVAVEIRVIHPAVEIRAIQVAVEIRVIRHAVVAIHATVVGKIHATARDGNALNGAQAAIRAVKTA